MPTLRRYRNAEGNLIIPRAWADKARPRPIRDIRTPETTGSSPEAERARQLQAAQAMDLVRSTQVAGEYRNIVQSFAMEGALNVQALAAQGIYLASVSAVQTAAEAASSLVGQSASLIETFLRVLADDIERTQQTKMNQVYAQVAAQARQRTISAYQRNLKNSGLHYRGGDVGPWRRYSNDAMLHALQSDALIRVTPQGIQFLVGSEFDVQARQWYRLNFGALPAAQRNPGVDPIQIFGETFEGASLAGFAPSGGFLMPKGVWSNQAYSSTAEFAAKGAIAPGGKAFYPSSQMDPNVAAKFGAFAKAGNYGAQSGRMSKGIVGTRFLDVGLNSINREMGPAMELIIREWVADAAGQTRATEGNLLERSAGGPLSAAMTVSEARATLNALDQRAFSNMNKARMNAVKRIQAMQYRNGGAVPPIAR